MSPLPQRTIDETAYLGLCAIASVVGLLIPRFYDWTGSDQSRLSPWIAYSFVGIALSLVGGWGGLIASHFAKKGHFTPSMSAGQLAIKHLLVVMIIVAAYLCVWMAEPIVASAMFAGGVLFFSFWLIARAKGMRWQTVGLLCCAYFPFLWVMGSTTMSRQFLLAFPSLPAILPLGFLSSFFGRHIEELTWLGLLLTSFQILVGIALIRIGPKLALAYCMLVLTMSTIGSFALNALVRM